MNEDVVIQPMYELGPDLVRLCAAGLRVTATTFQ